MQPLDDNELAVMRKRLYGVYPATVSNIKDPDQQGRVKIRLPWSPDDSSGYEVWARLAVPMAGNYRGTWLIPDVNDEVLVTFEAGDPRRPYVIGALWNGSDTPPESMDGAGNNYIKSIVSRQNIRITLDDTTGQETLTLQTPQQQKIVIQDGANSITIEDANGNTITLNSSGVTMQASQVEVTAGQVTVNAAISTFSGVVQADTVITNSVISASYTPGAGNIW
jgi:uncharacterized protein involved in type VI secretion and phage assembly